MFGDTIVVLRNTRFVDLFDENKDGVISRDEFRAFAKFVIVHEFLLNDPDLLEQVMFLGFGWPRLQSLLFGNERLLKCWLQSWIDPTSAAHSPPGTAVSDLVPPRPGKSVGSNIAKFHLATPLHSFVKIEDSQTYSVSLSS